MLFLNFIFIIESQKKYLTVDNIINNLIISWGTK